jgi:hypothetical protein
MANRQYVDRIVEAAGVSEEQASKALVAVFQGLLDDIGEKSNTNINISSTPDCNKQVVLSLTIIINNPSQPR